MMNGQAIEMDATTKHLVTLLDTTMQQVLSGQLRSIALIAVGAKGGFGCAFAGNQVGEMNMGLDQAKAQLLAACTQPAGQRSSIIRPL